MKKAHLLIILLYLSTLTGCHAPLVILPDDVGSDGLLVGQLASSTWPKVLWAEPLVSSEDPKFGIKKYIAGIRGNTMIVPLPPGDYTLNGFRRTTSSNTISTSYSTVTTRQFLTYPVQKKFTIESGRATNFGLIVYEPTLQPSKYSLDPVFLDNTAELTTYLKDRHAEMFTSLKNREFIKGYDTTPTPDQIKKLRTYIAAKRALSKKWQYSHHNDEIVTGIVGTIARIHKKTDGKYVLDKLYEPGTVTDLTNCGVMGQRAVCVTAHDTYLLLDKDTVSSHKGPEGVLLNSATAFGKSGILLIDDLRRLHISRDNGNSWSVYDGAQRDEVVERSSYAPIDVNSFGIHFGKSGYYVFEKKSDGDEAPLIYGDYVSGKHRIIRMPDTVDNVRIIEEKGGLLFVGPAFTEFMHDKFHYLDHNTQKWTVVDIPTHYCSEMAILDDEANHIELRCGRNDIRITEDRGITWSKSTERFTYFEGT